MKCLAHTIVHPAGLHVRPAGTLAKMVSNYDSTVLLKHGGNTVKLSNVVEVISLGIRQGEIIEIQVSGLDEDDAYYEIERFLPGNL